jgi:hypothetical protein
MASIAERSPFRARKTPPTSLTWQLLRRLWDFVRQRQVSLNPEELPPHLLRDLGLADQGFQGTAGNCWIR